MRAFTLVESLIATVIIAIMAVAAMNTVGATTAGRVSLMERAVGDALADDLMQEILARDFIDADEDTGVLGLEAGEVTGDRSLMDDVDDYESWTASPPQDEDGTKRTDYLGWSRTVKVVWVEDADPRAESGGATSVKRITVTVKRGDREVASRVAIRTAAADLMLDPS